jgi:hypothetical protein
MSVSSMGVRAALRTAQDVGRASKRSVVVSALGSPAGDSAPAAAPATKTNPIAQFLEKLTAWIPSESIALFLGFGGFFAVFEETSKEFALLGSTLAITFVLAFTATYGAHKRRGLAEGAATKAALTGVVATVAFVFWWAATPGTWLTADQGLDSFWVALALSVLVFGLPYLARALGIEPLRPPAAP